MTRPVRIDETDRKDASFMSTHPSVAPPDDLLSQDAAARTGVDEPMIERLVRGFYGRVQADAVLGPVFAARIGDWEPHLRRMMDFWSSVTLSTARYDGRPLRMHFPLPIDASHFDRWLQLFEATAREVCPPGAAEIFVERARRIAASFEMGLAVGRGQVLKRGERLRPT
jgi:hemoglobin